MKGKSPSPEIAGKTVPPNRRETPRGFFISHHFDMYRRTILYANQIAKVVRDLLQNQIKSIEQYEQIDERGNEAVEAVIFYYKKLNTH